jgi:hypothetical protein
VPDGPSRLWSLENFGDRLDAWAEGQQPDDDLRVIVTAWALSRMDDPYQGVRREPQFENYWFGTVPDSLRGDHVVTCAYWIFERERIVRCDSFATLGLPL